MAQPSELPGPDRVTVAVVAEVAAIADRVADRLTTRRRVDSGSLSVVVGDLNSVVVAVATPKSSPPDWGQVVRSLRAAHRPDAVIAAGLVRPSSEGAIGPSVAPITAAIDPDGVRYRPQTDGSQQSLTTACPGHETDRAAALAAWPGAIAAACAEFAIPLAMLGVDQGDQGGREWQHLKQQPSTAGKLGAAIAGIWKRPAFAKEAVERMAERWKRLDELVDRIEQTASAPGGAGLGPWLRD